MSILVPVPRINDMSGYRKLSPQEIEALREDMRQSSEWARAELSPRTRRPLLPPYAKASSQEIDQSIASSTA